MGTLRFLLAVAIVITHSSAVFGITSLGGISAVESFCMMSGFYMWMILNEKYIGQNNSYQLFITNRFLRIYPLYWTVLIAAVALAVIDALFFKNIPNNRIAPYIAFAPLLNPLVYGFIIFTNLFIFGQDVISFLGVNIHSGWFTLNSLGGVQYAFMFLPQSWSLSLELFFYLLVPILATKNIRLTIAIIIISLVGRFILYVHGYNYIPWNSRFLPFELALFLMGGICYVIYKKIKHRSFPKLLLNSIWIGLLLVTIFYQYFPGDDLKRWIYYALFAAALPFIFHLTKHYKWDRYIGELSYPLFLVQLLVVSLLQHTGIGDNYLGVTTIICSTGLAIVIYHFITIPIERIRQKRVKRSHLKKDDPLTVLIKE